MATLNGKQQRVVDAMQPMPLAEGVHLRAVAQLCQMNLVHVCDQTRGSLKPKIKVGLTGCGSILHPVSSPFPSSQKPNCFQFTGFLPRLQYTGKRYFSIFFDFFLTATV